MPCPTLYLCLPVVNYFFLYLNHAGTAIALLTICEQQDSRFLIEIGNLSRGNMTTCLLT